MNRKHAFGAALRAARISRGLPQDALGLAQSNISRLESGAKDPSWERVEELAVLLDVHPLTLFTLAYVLNEDQLDEQALLQRVQNDLFALMVVS